MTQLAATLRHRRAPLTGTFVALLLAAVLITVTASLIGTGITYEPPAQALAATSVDVVGAPDVAVTSGRGQNPTTDVLPLPAYRRVPTALARRIAAIPGVKAAVPDVSVPVAIVLPNGRVVAGSPAEPLTGHGWASAQLTPFVLRAGRAPESSGQIVVGASLAARTGLRVGDTIRLAGRRAGPFTVSGVAATPAGNPAGNWTVFFSDAEASALHGHPGEADLIGVIATAGTHSAALAARIATAFRHEHLRVLPGNRRGEAEDLAAISDRIGLSQFGTSAGMDVVLVALFVVASTVALSVSERRRGYALLRAVGATPGQVRRQVMAELGALGALAGLAGVLPGIGLATWAIRGLSAHELMPPGAGAWTSAWLLLIAAGAGTIVAELAGFFASRRASRTSPTGTLAQAHTDRRFPHPVRLVSGLGALAGGVTLGVVTVTQPLSAMDELNFALLMALSFMASVALLGPLLVTAAQLAVRLPVLLCSGLAGRLALAEMRARPRRMAAAVVSVALALAFSGAVYVTDATQAHAAVIQARQRLSAQAVVSAPGPGLAPGALGAVRAVPGVTAAVGITPTTIFAPYPGNETTAAEAVTPGPLTRLLDLHVVAGSLRGFGPGDIALSRLVGGKGAIGAHVGERLTTYLADGTPYRATVTAIYARSLGFADAIIPAHAAGGGHLGASSLGAVLAAGSPGTPTSTVPDLRKLAASYPGLEVAPRHLVNAQDELLTAQTSYVNNLVLGLIAALAGVALVNTLVMATRERRDALRLLQRAGMTDLQLIASMTWEAVLLGCTGILLGAGSAAATIAVVTRALTGSWQPYITWPPAAVILGLVALITGLAILAPAMKLISRDA